MFLSNDYDEIMAHWEGKPPRADGYNMILKIHIEDQFIKKADGTFSTLEIPESVREEKIYICMTGLILDIGPDCYKPEKFKNYTPRQVGEWVLFIANAGSITKCKGVPLRYVAEEHILGSAPVPEWFSRD